ncbi:FAD-binding oxidoreductase, partial [Frankia sp. AiPs1]|nr:FAD-binding oxidoreductase [Frankia sp. AiPs1]
MSDSTLAASRGRAGERVLPGFGRAALPAVTPLDPGVLDALSAELAALVGADAVLRDEPARLSASTDWAHMSPVLAPLLPGGVADVV